MKCLEFLYFYLLPEDGSGPANPRCTSSPTRPQRIDTSFSYAGVPAPSKSVPGSPVHHSGAKVPIPLGLTASSPELSLDSEVRSPGMTRPEFTSPQLPKRPTTPDQRSAALQLLKQEIEYEPVSPKKAQVAKLGVGTPAKFRKDSNTLARRGTPVDTPTSTPSKLLFPSFAPNTPAKKKLVGSSRLAETKRRSDSEDVKPLGNDVLRKKIHSKCASVSTIEPLSRSNSGHVFDESTNTPMSARVVPPASPTKTPKAGLKGNWPSNHPFSQQNKPRIRSTEEKKELLGNWLGNVDALVEGVQKAGVWGLA